MSSLNRNMNSNMSNINIPIDGKYGPSSDKFANIPSTPSFRNVNDGLLDFETTSQTSKSGSEFVLEQTEAEAADLRAFRSADDNAAQNLKEKDFRSAFEDLRRRRNHGKLFDAVNGSGAVTIMQELRNILASTTTARINKDDLSLSLQNYPQWRAKAFSRKFTQITLRSLFTTELQETFLVYMRKAQTDLNLKSLFDYMSARFIGSCPATAAALNLYSKKPWHFTQMNTANFKTNCPLLSETLDAAAMQDLYLVTQNSEGVQREYNRFLGQQMTMRRSAQKSGGPSKDPRISHLEKLETAHLENIRRQTSAETEADTLGTTLNNISDNLLPASSLQLRNNKLKEEPLRTEKGTRNLALKNAMTKRNTWRQKVELSRSTLTALQKSAESTPLLLTSLNEDKSTLEKALADLTAEAAETTESVQEISKSDSFSLSFAAIVNKENEQKVSSLVTTQHNLDDINDRINDISLGPERIKEATTNLNKLEESRLPLQEDIEKSMDEYSKSSDALDSARSLTITSVESHTSLLNELQTLTQSVDRKKEEAELSRSIVRDSLNSINELRNLIKTDPVGITSATYDLSTHALRAAKRKEQANYLAWSDRNRDDLMKRSGDDHLFFVSDNWQQVKKNTEMVFGSLGLLQNLEKSETGTPLPRYTDRFKTKALNHMIGPSWSRCVKQLSPADGIMTFDLTQQAILEVMKLLESSDKEYYQLRKDLKRKLGIDHQSDMLPYDKKPRRQKQERNTDKTKPSHPKTSNPTPDKPNNNTRGNRGPPPLPPGLEKYRHCLYHPTKGKWKPSFWVAGTERDKILVNDAKFWTTVVPELKTAEITEYNALIAKVQKEGLNLLKALCQNPCQLSTQFLTKIQPVWDLASMKDDERFTKYPSPEHVLQAKQSKSNYGHSRPLAVMTRSGKPYANGQNAGPCKPEVSGSFAIELQNEFGTLERLNPIPESRGTSKSPSSWGSQLYQ